MGRLVVGIALVAALAACGEVTSTPDGGGGGGGDGGAVDGATPDGGGGGGGELTIDDDSHDFGGVPVEGSGARFETTVRNGGDEDIGPLTLQINGPAASDYDADGSDCEGATLEPGATCTVEVLFQPSTSGARTGQVAIGDGGDHVVYLDVTGRGLAAGALTLSPTTHDFGDRAIGATANHVFTVENAGETEVADLELSVSDTANFEIVTTTCTGALAGGGSCTVQVKYAPVAGGAHQGSVSALSGDTGVSSTLTGTGTAQLTVTKAGTGSGGVVSAAGIDCGDTCTAEVKTASVTLNAQPAPGSELLGWSVASCGTKTACTIPVDAATIAVTTNFRKIQTLTVKKGGSGSGNVKSSDGSIDCGTTCETTKPLDTTVTLTPTAASGSVFGSWSGCDSISGTTCTVKLSADKTVTANFTQQYKLTVSKSGSAGTVTSNPAGINCGTTCSASYNSGTGVTLTATAGSNSVFSQWSGACSGTSPTCNLTMSVDRSVTATFKTQYTLSLAVKNFNGAIGSVAVSNPSTSCSGSCTYTYATSTSVTLSPKASQANCTKFTGWSGACSGTGSCTLTMSTSRSATANFDWIAGCIPQ